MIGRRRRFEPITILGLVMTILLHGGAVVGVFLYRRALQASQQRLPPPPPSYVVAKLLRLGKPKDARKVPDKIVPQVATKKEETVDLSADAADVPSKKKKDPDRDAQLGDKLRHSLDKADLLANAQREIEGEGSSDGVPGGTATKAEGGDPYMTKVADIWNRTWALPSIIPREEAKRLYVLLVLHIDKDSVIQTPIQFDRKSGNSYFDSSVVAAWAAIRKLPQPPPDRFAAILANGLALKITWKGLQ